VIVPLNRAGGNRVGFRAQLLFFLDELMPSLFEARCSAASHSEVRLGGDCRARR